MRLVLAILMTASTALATDFTFFGEGVAVSTNYTLQDGRQGAITLPSTLPANELYLAWPKNQYGYGEPIAINKAEAWWVGFDTVSTGETFYVYGRNLALGDGTNSHLYCVEENDWLTSTTNTNPYKAEFVVPTNWANGTKTIYAHNGHGKKYGWSESLSLTVESPYAWVTNRVNVTDDPYNADNTGASDCQAEIEAAMNATPSGGICYFPAGTYAIKGVLYLDRNKQYVGDGTNTIITATDTGRTSDFLIYTDDNTKLRDFTILLSDAVINNAPLQFGGEVGLIMENVVIDDRNSTRNFSHGLRLSNGERFLISNCTFYLQGGIAVNPTDQSRFVNNTFYGLWDNNQMITIRRSTGVDMTGWTATNYDVSDAVEGYGWAKGRWIVDDGENNCVYIGENETINMLARRPTPFFTNGVITSYSALGAEVDVPDLDPAKPCTFTFDNIPNEFHGRGDGSVEWSGVKVWVPVGPDGIGPDGEDALPCYVKTMDAINNTCTVYIKKDSYSEAAKMSPTYTVSAVMADIVDQNSGEQYLYEGPQTYYTGIPIATSSNSITFAADSYAWDNRAKAMVAYVVNGTGLGQHLLVDSVISNGTGIVMTLTDSWRVTPDTSSSISYGTVNNNQVFYSNKFDGRPEALPPENYSASAGVQIYGSGYQVDIVGNTFIELSRGVSLQQIITTKGEPEFRTINQSAFCFVKDNVFSNCYDSIFYKNSGSSTNENIAVDSTALCNMFVDNISSNAVGSFYSSTSGDITLLEKFSIFVNNSIVGSVGFYEEGGFTNQIWIGNTTNGVSWKP
jgi:hypothetical protein